MDYKAFTDEQLIAKAGNSELGELVCRHESKILTLAYRILGRWDLAEDINQEVFLRVRKAAKHYRPEAKFSTWLYRIVVNLCLDEKRKAGHAPVQIANLPEATTLQTDDNPVAKQEKEERARLVRRALDQLNKRQRLVVVLHRFQGLSHREITDITGWSESAVESLLVRAYRKLREELKELHENDT